MLGIIGLYWGILSEVTSGRPVAPLDDAYITYQYAKQMARGFPYQYNDGDAPTTGMTSFLFTLLLAGFHRLGVTGEALVAVSVRLGVLWLGLTAWLLSRIVQILGQPGPLGRARSALSWPGALKWQKPPGSMSAWIIPLTIILTVSVGSLQWGYFNGMETGLFTVLILAALAALLRKRYGIGSVWLGLSGLTRPEGLVLTLVTCGVVFVHSLWRRRIFPWKPLLALSIALVAGLLPSLLAGWFTGDFSSASLQAKSWFYNVPAYPREVVSSVLISYRRILQRFMGFGSMEEWFVPPGIFCVSLVGWFALLWQRRWWPLLLTLAWFFLGTFSTATLITATWHVGRYQVPFVPLITLLAGYGASFIIEGVCYLWCVRAGFQAPAVVLQGMRWFVGLILLLPSFYTTYQAVRLYRQAVYTVLHQQLAMADWINVHIPARSYIGVHDVGAIRYVGGRPTYDLIGLTTAGATLAWRHGAGSVFETMESASPRPTYFATYPDVFSIPYFVATDLFDEVLFSVNVPQAVVASAGPVQSVWRADWRLAGSGTGFYQPDIRARTEGLRLVDSLDVADLEDEAAHNLTWWQNDLQPGFPTEVQQLNYRVPAREDERHSAREVLDGGRLLNGGLTVHVHAEPHRPLWIVSRLHAREAGGVHVKANGDLIGDWRYPPIPGQWLETLFCVPAEAVTHADTMISLAVDGSVTAPTSHYAPYYFWFLQGDANRIACHPQFSSLDRGSLSETLKTFHSVSATFGENIALVGFEVPTQTWRPGDTVPVVLYWHAKVSGDVGRMKVNDAKVFLHLYDPTQMLVTQSDGWAYYGTRPPYTWQLGETVVDPRALDLPPDLPAGQYALEVGLYTSGGRLPAYLHGHRQLEDRVFLTNLAIENREVTSRLETSMTSLGMSRPGLGAVKER